MSSKEHSCYSDELQDKGKSGGSKPREVEGESQLRRKYFLWLVHMLKIRAMMEEKNDGAEKL